MKHLFAISVLLSAPSLVSSTEISKVEVSGKSFTVCKIEVGKDKLSLFLKDDAGQPFRKFDRLETWLGARNERLVFAMNAGMFQHDLSTVGLCVIDGKPITPLNTAEGQGNFFLKPNGVFALTENGVRVVESMEFNKMHGRVLIATQSGPLLVQEGKIHPSFNAGSSNRLIRNGVGVPTPSVAIFVISETPVNFHEFATLFRDNLKCPNALYLDGVVSSLHASSLKRSDIRTDLGPILAVTEKATTIPTQPNKISPHGQ